MDSLYSALENMFELKQKPELRLNVAPNASQVYLVDLLMIGTTVTLSKNP